MKRFPLCIEALESRIAPAAAIFELSSLNGANGFKLNGVAPGDFLGRSVSDAGDINGDGFGDMILGAPLADPNGLYSGASYVVFGKATGFDREVELSDLDGTNGFRFAGFGPDDNSASSVSAAGDLNGDGFGDLIIGARSAGRTQGRPGESYVVFGKRSGFSPDLTVSMLDGANGFTLVGGSPYAEFGSSVSAAGDVNGDGFDDVIVGAPKSQISPGVYGASYVVFGKADAFAPRFVVSSLTGANGFRMTGRGSGSAVTGAGDVNGDGFDDLLIGVPDANRYSVPGATAGYVVFGKAGGFASNLDLSTLDGTNGFKMNRIQTGDNAGRTVSGAGDFNGDGFDDLIIGAPYIGPAGARIGNAYLIFGKASGFNPSFDLANLNGANGFKVTGAALGDNAGYSVSGAGDINGDGFNDVIIGAGGAAPHGTRSGSTFVIFGTARILPTNLDLAALDAANGFRLNGVAFAEFSGNSVSGAGDVNGDGLDDLMISAPYAEPHGRSSGTTYIVFGMPQSISINDVNVVEGASATSIASFKLSLSGSSTRPVTVKYATVDGTATASDDYVAVAPTTVTFAPGEVTKNVSVTINGDRTFEPDETFLVTLTDPTNATLAAPQGHGTIVNDETLPAISIADASVVEGADGIAFAGFAVTLSHPSSQPIAVKYATANGTATASEDYTPVALTDLTFTPGEISKFVNVAVKGDLLYEADETFRLVLSTPTNATVVDGEGEATLINDEDLPNVHINDTSVLEGASGVTLATFTVFLTGASAFPVTVEYTTTDGSAVAPDDYTAMPPVTLTFNPGELSKTINVAVNGGTVFEPNESFFVNLANPTNGAIGDGQGEGTILTDELRPAISISDASVTEATTRPTIAFFTVTLSAPSSETVSVEYATIDGTATSPEDYAALQPTSLVFQPGEVSKTVGVTVKSDAIFEVDESFFVALGNPTNAALSDARGEGTIFTDETLPVLSISDASVTEGGSGMALAPFTITLSGPSSQPVTVAYATFDGTASALADYIPVGLTNVVFAPGEVAKTVVVSIVGDRVAEAHETFSVKLSAPVNATLGNAHGEGTILNDDVLVRISSNGRKASFTDNDGDPVTIKTNRGTLDQENFVFGPDGALLVLDLLPSGNAAEFANAAIAISTKGFSAGAGDGLVNLGAINANGVDLGKVKVEGNLGGIVAGDADATRPAIGMLTVNSLGRIGGAIEGVNAHSAIHGAIGVLKVKHDVIGATVAIEGNLIPATSLEAVALKKLQIGGSIADSFIGVGFNGLGTATNPDVQVGAVSVVGDWRTTSLAVGLADSTNDGFGRNDALIPGGSPAFVAKIASVVIRGAVEGSAIDGDFFGITAQQIGRLIAGGSRPPLSAGPNEFLLDPVNGDFRVVDFA